MAPSLPSEATVRSGGEGQVVRMTPPAVAQPQSRRLNLVLRLLLYFGLTWAFVMVVEPLIDRPCLRSCLAKTVFLDKEEGWIRQRPLL